MLALLLLGFSSGLPLALTADTLQAWLTDSGVDLGTIGLFALVGLPYTLKFLWAPFIDRYAVPLLGRRRGWLLVTQCLLIVCIAAMAMTDPKSNLMSVAILALTIAFFSASQDIVVDAYRADVLEEAERAAGAALAVSGYRIAMIVSAAGALWLSGSFDLSWPTIYLVMAAAMLAGIVATLLAPEPAARAEPPPTLVDAVVKPLAQFFARPTGLLVLAFVVVFRLPDNTAGAMTVPFMLKVGFAKVDIAAVRQFAGIALTIAGALTGGWVVAKLGLIKSLWIFGLLQAVSNVGFLILSVVGPDYATMVIVISVESFCGGLVTAGFMAFLMSQCDIRYSATQYALLSSLMAQTRVLGATPTGYLAEHLGWTGFFAMTVFAALPGMMILYFLRPAPPAAGIGFDVVMKTPA